MIQGAISVDYLTQQGIYTYAWANDFDKFSHTKLPPIECFKNDLTGEECGQEDYSRALAVWDHFKMKAFKDYHDLYVYTDVLLLADVFDNFRKTMTKSYDLDPCNYLTLSMFSWDAALLMCKEVDVKGVSNGKPLQLGLMSDLEIYKMIEKGERGGMCQVSMSQIVANNPYMGVDYNEYMAQVFIMNLDANNLYGFAMVQNLPYDGYTWNTKFVDQDLEQTIEDIKNYNPKTSPIGCFFEVDLEYPKELHDSPQD
jgi:hypothetical protein